MAFNRIGIIDGDIIIDSGFFRPGIIEYQRVVGGTATFTAEARAIGHLSAAIWTELHKVIPS